MIPTSCIHYVSPRDGANCKAGVDIHGKPTPEKHHYPCLGFVRQRFGANGWTEIPCPHFRLPTDEEIAKDEEEYLALVERIKKTRPITDPIRVSHRGRSYQGVHTCPNCGKPFHVHMAPNGHMRGKCETTGCVHWIE
jgi:hypothetical protein